MIRGGEVFVLLDDARARGAAPARLYRNPAGIIEARRHDEVRPCLARLREAGAAGLHAAGFLAYEAGLSLEDRLSPLRAAPAGDAPPLLWFGLFEACEEMAPSEVPALLGDGRGAWAAPPVPGVDRAAHAAAFAQVKRHIEAGDIYQANLTFRAEVAFGGTPAALYAALRARSRAAHGALLFTGSHWLLSFSPELFFEVEDGGITARPMKGTARRAADPAQDAAAAEVLAADPKQRAENLMIVDLMRNDLAKVARTGSVAVPALFSVETYPTVHQMTSTVTAQLDQGMGPVDLIEAAFPCGSVTGAPKIRAMEIIAGLEAAPRHVYTGAIGRLAPSGDAGFNVAIRTLAVRGDGRTATLGLGSGVVADSRADEEWLECLAKGAFVSDANHGFDLIETMAFDPEEGIANLERHLARIKASAEALGFAFDRHDARNELQAATFRFREGRRVRLLLSRAGNFAIEARPLPARLDAPVAVRIVPLPVPASDFRLRHKTSDRRCYEEARRGADCFEVLFADDDGFLTQGSFTNLFVERDGVLLTPPLSRPILPGILRAQLIEEGRAREAELRAEDLAEGFLIGNAVRGLMRGRLA